MRMIINGQPVDLSKCQSFNSVVIGNGGVFIDGKNVSGSFMNGSFGPNINIQIQGDVQNLKAAGSVTVEGHAKNVESSGRCTIHGDVKGNIKSSGTVTCKDVYGDIDASGSVYCDTHNEKDWDRDWNF